MWELDYQESWALKNWCFWIVVLEKTLESPFDCKEIKPVNPKGNQSWIFIRRTNAEAETPILWPPDAKGWLIWKDLDAGKDWRQEEKGMTEDEMVGWHHGLDEHEFEWAPGVGDVQGGLVCCSPQVAKSWTRVTELSTLLAIIISKATQHWSYDGFLVFEKYSYSNSHNSIMQCYYYHDYPIFLDVKTPSWEIKCSDWSELTLLMRNGARFWTLVSESVVLSDVWSHPTTSLALPWSCVLIYLL